MRNQIRAKTVSPTTAFMAVINLKGKTKNGLMPAFCYTRIDLVFTSIYLSARGEF